jgi:hypothetical protein
MKQKWLPSLILLFVICVTDAASAQSMDSLSSRRFAVRFGVGVSFAPTVGDYKDFLTRNGYYAYDNNDPFESSRYNATTRGTGMTLIAEYYPKPRFAVGLAFATLDAVIGHKGTQTGDQYFGAPTYYSATLSEEHSSEGWFLVASYVPYRFKSRYTDLTILLTGGIGMNTIDITYNGSGNYNFVNDGNPDAVLNIRKRSFGIYALASFEQEIFNHVAAGVCFEYRFIPTQTIDGFTLPLTMQNYPNPPHSYDLQVPSHSINFSDLRLGLVVAFHW